MRGCPAFCTIVPLVALAQTVQAQDLQQQLLQSQQLLQQLQRQQTQPQQPQAQQPSAAPQPQRMVQPTSGQLAARDQDDFIFFIVANAYRSLPTKPKPDEEAHRLALQANEAVQQNRLADAANLYDAALRRAPWWPQANYNFAVIMGQLGLFHLAISGMNRYLACVPDAANASQVREQIATWKREDVVSSTDPADELDREVAGGKVRLGLRVAGIAPIVAQARHLASTQGAIIGYVAKGSVAEACGLRAEDIVVAFAGNPVVAAADLPRAIGAAPANMLIPIELIRGEQRLTLTVQFAR